MRILLLDDDLGFLFWIAKALEPLGHRVIPVETASKARGLVRKWGPSVDLLIVNPVVRGAEEFCRCLRRSRQVGPKVLVLRSLEAAGSISDRTASDLAGFVQQILYSLAARAN